MDDKLTIWIKKIATQSWIYNTHTYVYIPYKHICSDRAILFLSVYIAGFVIRPWSALTFYCYETIYEFPFRIYLSFKISKAG